MVVTCVAVAGAPYDIVPGTSLDVVRKIEIEGVESFVNSVIDALIAIEVSLQRDIGTVGEGPVPTS